MKTADINRAFVAQLLAGLKQNEYTEQYVLDVLTTAISSRDEKIQQLKTNEGWGD